MKRLYLIDEIFSRLDVLPCEVKIVSLTTDEKTLTERIMRDVQNGKRTLDVLERSLTRIPLYEQLNSIKIDTGGKAVQTVADEIKRL